jgi:hypothetical protein
MVWPHPAADAWGIKIFVITSFLENCVIAIDPVQENPAFVARALHLSFWAEVRVTGLPVCVGLGRGVRRRWWPRALGQHA